MLLVVDIGNTNIVAGCFKGEQLLYQFRLKTDPCSTVDEYRALMMALILSEAGERVAFNRAVVSSVVPPVTPKITELIKTSYQVDPLVVGPGVKTGLSIRLSNPAAVGSDRVVNALAAKHLYGLPALVVDFGTATSFDYVDAESNYRGGAIAPGLETSLDSLVSHTAKLPRIELTWPEAVIGHNTEEAMQSGSVIGYVCLVEGLIRRIIAEAGPIPHVIATGGMGKLISGHTSLITDYNPSLTLAGLKIIADLNS